MLLRGAKITTVDDVRYFIDKRKWENHRGPPPGHPCADPKLKNTAKCRRTIELFNSAVTYDIKKNVDRKESVRCLTGMQKADLKRKDKLKILHIGTGTLIQNVYRDLQQKDGNVSHVMVHTTTAKKGGYDMNLSMSPYEFGWGHNIKSILANTFNGNFRDLLRYDVYHIHHDAFLLPSKKDIAWLKYKFKKKVLLDWRGQGVRVWGFNCIPWLSKIRQICSSPDLLDFQEYEGQFEWLPFGIDIGYFNRIKTTSDEDNPLIMHATANWKIKGTDHVLKAVDELKKEGYKFRFLLNDKVPYETTVKNYAKSDIVVDWINPIYGIYGTVSIESMALGKACCASLNPKYDRYLPGCPVVNCSPKDLKEKLIYLIENPSERKRIGKEGKEYVRKMHDIKKIKDKLYDIYDEC
ncbi:hypothetical protein COV19_05800 [Candidatus Woesearchaeota archaeon CG10_big_fil_rev_8_21_14_0_10_44_13]|nr:MAG: hypothetical protein COV19_05800 [Candidatus Woesearchaeota archaeon CG10_big_fil_rev_8_21_14_0_10_44_13]